MSFNIQAIEGLSISHFVVVVAITMVTVVTTIVVKDCVSALKRFLSNQKNIKYSKIFVEDIITILGYSVLVWYITKGDEPNVIKLRNKALIYLALL
jgi:uncharacterized membrane protein YedE/YeeE